MEERGEFKITVGQLCSAASKLNIGLTHSNICHGLQSQSLLTCARILSNFKNY